MRWSRPITDGGGCSRGRPIRAWDVKEGKTVGILSGHEGAILDIVLSPDGRTALTASSDGTIRGWDLDSGRLRIVHPGRPGKVDAVAIAPGGEIAYSIHGDTVVARRLNPYAQLGSLSLDHQITALAVVPDGRRLALGDESGQVHFLRFES
jgi:WD40 repeat protein